MLKEKRDSFTLFFALSGTIILWVPLLAPVFFTVVSLMSDGIFRFDYFMPAELFPIALTGGLLLIWASLRAKFLRKIVTWSICGAGFMLAGGQIFAIVTGLASGITKPEGWMYYVALSSIILYILLLLSAAISGIFLLKELLKKNRQTPL